MEFWIINKAKYINNSIVAIVFLVVAFQSISLTSRDLPLIMVLYFPLLSLLLVIKGVTIKSELLFCYFFVFISVLLSFIYTYGGINFSYMSMMYFVVLYFIYSVYFHKKSSKVALFFVDLLFVMSLIAVMQFFLQRLGLGYWYVGDFVSSNLLFDNYNYLYEYPYGSGVYKINGFFFLEPSFLSQFIALAIIVEFLGRKRLVYFCIFFITIFLSKTGSGFLLLLVFFIFVSLQKKEYFLFSIVMSLLLSVLLFVYGEDVVSRLSEFGRENTSAFVRFVAPFLNLSEYWGEAATLNILLGEGAGSVDSINLTYHANYPLSVKLTIEYGLITSVILHFYMFLFFKNSISKGLKAPLFVFMFLSSGAMLQPITLFTVWFFQFIPTVLSDPHNISRRKGL
ncbi:hypothetical protein [Neptuniibacter pectenicola]|uniref:hypothetical protein n=1 Tax=Neptuniibacter pectenicola TaxID=1806669 RepID=UPI00082BA51F|nr:hypothetical protein [Neptuniibacter pectenicola]